MCPTGALFRTEFGTVVVQQDICNGCGYCVPACPFGVLDRREDDGRVWKCTLCYDRLKDDLEPACAKACPTDSIQFGELDELRERAAARLEQLHGGGRWPRRSSTAPIPTTASAASARSSCCSTSPRSTACRPTRSTPTRDLGETVAATARRRGCALRRRRSAAAVLGEARGERAASYYGRPVIKAPVWTPEIPIYFFIGGLAGASRRAVALLAEAARQRRARAARWAIALAGVAVSPALLISDLGRARARSSTCCGCSR